MNAAASPLLWYPGTERLIDDIVRAENCHLFDAAGRRFVDLESGVWCMSVGHGHPRVVRALTEQLGRIAHTGFAYSNAVVDEAAREVLTLLGLDGGRCVFLCSGSEAVEYAVRVAQWVSPRPLMLTMSDSYFGAYGSASRKAGDEWYVFDWNACGECPDGRCDGSCERWSAIPWDRIGGFLFEPGSSSGLVRFPPERLVGKIVREVRERGGLVLVNEVTTGIGRTGAWFGHQHYAFTPDIVATGKGIGNGYPVSVTALGPRVAGQLGDHTVKYGQSHQNDPLGAAVVREVIRVIREEGLVERGIGLGERLRSGLERVRERTSGIREIRGRGLMVAVELEDDADDSFTRGIHRELLRRGYVIGRRAGAHVLRIDPSLTIDEADIDGFLQAFEAVLAGQGAG